MIVAGNLGETQAQMDICDAGTKGTATWLID